MLVRDQPLKPHALREDGADGGQDQATVLLPHPALHIFQLFGAANGDFVFLRLQTLRQPPATRPNSCAKPANVVLAISELLRVPYRH
jgi:hypothetical protein